MTASLQKQRFSLIGLCAMFLFTTASGLDAQTIESISNTKRAKTRDVGQWPMPGRDTAQSCYQPLPGRMTDAPSRVIAFKLGVVPVRQPIDNWARVADVDGDGNVELLWRPDGKVICTDMSTGERRWASNVEDFDHLVDLDGDGTLELTCGPTIYSAATGEMIWSHTKEPGTMANRRTFAIGDFDPNTPGPEAIIRNEGEQIFATYLSFAEGLTKPTQVWRQLLANATGTSDWFSSMVVCGLGGDMGTSLVYGGAGGVGAIALPSGRTHFYAPMKSGFGYRHYGQYFVRDVDRDNAPEIVLVEDIINLRIAVLQPSVEAKILRWHTLLGGAHPQGEHVMRAVPTSVFDVDADGHDEILYSMHHDSTGWVLYCHSTIDGSVEWTADHLYLHKVVDLNGDGLAEVIASPMVNRAPVANTGVVFGAVTMSDSGPVFNVLWRIDDASVVGNKHFEFAPNHGGRFAAEITDFVNPYCQDVNGDGDLEILVSQTSDGVAAGRTYVVGLNNDGQVVIEQTIKAHVAAWLDMRPEPGVEMLVDEPSGAWSILSADGARLLELKPPSTKTMDVLLGSPTIADLDGDGVNEILGTLPGEQVGVFHLPDEPDGVLKEIWRVRGRMIPGPLMTHNIHAPDLDGDGKREVLLLTGKPGDVGQVTLFDHQGKPRWTTILEGTTAGSAIAPAFRINFGYFNDDDVLDVFAPRGLGTDYAGPSGDCVGIDGRTGEIMWVADRMASYNKVINPTTWAPIVDWDYDGRDDIAVFWAHRLIVINGATGDFHLRPLGVHGWWGQMRVADTDLDGDPETVIMGGHSAKFGAFVLRTVTGEAEDLLWRGVADKWGGVAATVDIDNDGAAETIISAEGACRDARTGAIEWQLEDLGVSKSPWITACDINGDGRIEWLGSNAHIIWAVGVDANGKPRRLWQRHDPLNQPYLQIADVDSDGYSEIISGSYYFDE